MNRARLPSLAAVLMLGLGSGAAPGAVAAPRTAAAEDGSASDLGAEPAALSIDDAVHETVARNPAVRAAEAQYEAALHQIDQVYAPSDPTLSLSPGQTPNGFTYAQTRTVGVGESLQFPGKGWLQGGQARRAAEIARLAYLAAVRDATAQAKTAYYQTLLDGAAARINAENAASVGEVLAVVRISYTANQNAQTDLISAQFALSVASQSISAAQVAEANDEAALNALLRRRPESPLRLTSAMELEAFPLPLETVKERAMAFKQELLEAALTETNAKTALTLARMEFLPDFIVSWTRNSYPPNSINAPRAAAANPNVPGDLGPAAHDFTTGLSFNLPIFGWFRQREDVHAAEHLLNAAREGRDAASIQTETSVVQLYRSMELAYKNALLNRDVLAPLAAQNLKVGLIAYQSRRIDFTTLAGILQSVYGARLNYLTAANQFLAGRVALEQAMGGPSAK